MTEYTFRQTLGKVLTKAKVVSWSGDKPTLNQIIFRTLIRSIPFEYFSYLTTVEGIQDKLPETRVVKGFAITGALPLRRDRLCFVPMAIGMKCKVHPKASGLRTKFNAIPMLMLRDSPPSQNPKPLVAILFGYFEIQIPFQLI